MDTLLFWATILSPIIGVIAIIVALIVSHSSTKKAQQQIVNGRKGKCGNLLI